MEFGEPWKLIKIEIYHFLLVGILKLISFEIDWEMSKILTLDSALPHLWKLKKSMGEKYRFQLFLCTKIMIKNSKFDNGTHFDNCLFLRLIIKKSSFRGLQNPTMKISFIQVWSPAECEPQGDYYCKENPKCYHRTVKSSSPIESWRNNNSFNNDLLLGHCCCLNCLNCISIWSSIWPNPYFNIFYHQEYKRKWFLRMFQNFFIQLSYHGSFLYFTRQFILVW